MKATAAAVARDELPGTAARCKWLGIMLVLLVGCGLTSYFVHLYGESDEEDQDQTMSLPSMGPAAVVMRGLRA